MAQITGRPILGKPKSFFDQIDEIEPKTFDQLIDETPTQDVLPDTAKRLGRGMVDQPGALVQSLGTAFDAFARTAAASSIIENADMLRKVPEERRKRLGIPQSSIDNAMAEAMQAANTENPAARMVKDTGRQMRKTNAELYTGDFAPDPARDPNFVAKVADSAPSMAAALVTPGGVVGKTMMGMLQNSQGAADEAEKTILARGGSEEDANTAGAQQFVLNLPFGALESIGWGKLLGRYGKAIEHAVEEKWGKTAIKRLAKATAEQFVTEGAEEGAQQLGQNAAAKATYDPNRKLSEGVVDSALVGGAMGAGTGGGFQAAAEFATKLDTGKNIPERREDLKAQQEQLLRGERTAQMFPTGTEEIPLPKGMARVVTPRGVFHYNPKLVNEDVIRGASEKGNENLILGLGPHSKTDVQERMDAGEPGAAMVERGPKGEELRSAVVTPSTAKATGEVMQQGKSPDSSVNLEDMESVLTKRGGLDAMIDAADEEAKARTAEKEKATKERDERQQVAKDKREKFDFHLGNAARIAEGLAANGSVPVAEVSGVNNVLRDYIDDNTLGLTLEQKQQARTLLQKLEPAETTLKAQDEAATAQREAEAQAKAQADRLAQNKRIREENRTIAKLNTDALTGRKRLDAMTDDELATEAQAGNTGALRLLETRSQGSETTGGNEFMDVLETVKLPETDAVLGGEIARLKEETKSKSLFSGRQDLDRVAEAFRERGFTQIQTPADVIEYAQRALRGEKIRPQGRGEEQIDFARAEPIQAPRRPKWDDSRGREQLTEYVADVDRWRKEMREFAKNGPDVMVFREAAPEGSLALVSRNTREGEQAWRVTWFEEKEQGGNIIPTGHKDYATKEQAILSMGPSNEYAPEVAFSKTQDAPGEMTNRLPEDDAEAELTVKDFEARLQRIAPGLMMTHRVLVGDPTMLHALGVKPETLTGREQAAHFARRKLLWFLARNIRAGKDGLMPDRLRRDVIHETVHAWIASLDADMQLDLRTRWEAEKAAPSGWLATMRKQGVTLRSGVETDWHEYWAERIAQENTGWAGRREGAVTGGRGFVSQLAYDFRTWLKEALEFLQQAFTRTKRYNVDFRTFLDDRRFHPKPDAEPVGAAPAPLSAASSKVEFASEESPEERKQALVRQLNNLRREINKAVEKGGQARRISALQGERSEFRMQLDQDYPGWWKDHPEGPDGIRAETSTAKPVTEEDFDAKPTETSEQTEPEPDALPAPEAEYSPREDIFDEVEGHTTVNPSWKERSWDWMKKTFQGIRGPIPELPTFADENAQQYSKLRLFNKLIKRGTPRVWKEASDQVGAIVQPLLKIGKLNANDYDRLGRLQNQRKKLREDNRTIPDGMADEIADLNRKVEAEPYGLFQKIAMYLDLKWRVENLKDEQGNAITQPSGINAAEIKTRLAELKEALAINPHRETIMGALREHQTMVKKIAEDLRARDLSMPEELQNPFYFPHVILGDRQNALESVKLDTQEDFRSYLLKPVGSIKPIETDYAKAMYYHLVAVGSHNLRSDLVADYVKPYDVMEDVRAKAKEMSKEYGRAVSWREAYATHYAKNGFTTYHPDDKLPMHPEMMISRDTLARRLGVILTEAPLQKQLEELGLKGIKILPEDISEAMAAGEKETWILPEKVAEALNGMLRREEGVQDNIIGKPIAAFQGLWKKNILFAPWNYPRYEFNNTVADLEKLFSADPEVFRRLSSAAKEVRQFIEEGKGGRDVHEAFKLGVLDSVTASEVNDLSVLRQFEALRTDKQKLTRSILKRLSTMFLAGERSTMDLSKLREATFRYAKFKADLDRMNNGARPVYAGAYWKDIDAITDSRKGANDANYHKAAEISLATFGDYHNISVAGQQLRRYLIPFYSWMEINFRYHSNLFRNLKDMAVAGEMSRADAAKAGTRAAAVMAATFTRKAAAGALLRLALPYLAMLLWNNTGDRDELEDTLSAEDKRRFHIIMGKDANGKTMVMYGQTAFADVAKWFGGTDALRLAGDTMSGRTDFKTAVGDWMHQFPRDFVNNLFQVGPAVKIAYTLGSGKSTFPDVTDQRSIPAYDLKWNILGQATDQFTADMIRRAADKDYLAPRDVKDWAMQTILQVRKRDPQQWAFYEIKDKSGNFLEAKTGQTRESDYNAPDQQVLRNFRKSIYRGDVENAMKFYDRLLELGYTSDRFKASIRAQDPLSTLPKALRREFVESLSPFERTQLERAFEFYARMTENRGSENALFPSKKMSDRARANYTPRHDRLREELQNVEQYSDDELKAKGEQELKRSLRPALR